MPKKYGAKNSLMSPRFTGVKTFMRMENIQTTQDVDFAVIGIPFDTCASYRVGTRLGPAAIRDVSCLAAKPFNEAYGVGIFDALSGVDAGDLESIPGYIEESFQLITDGLAPYFANHVIPVSMGGDHSVTLAELRACAKTYGPVSLIHFDAHYDTVHEYFGKPYNHGTPFFHAAKEGLVDTAHSIQVGIREGLYGPEDQHNSPDLGYQVIRGDECHRIGMDAVVEKIRERVGNRKAFLTFDIDFLDPAYAPGTGTPVPGGFTTFDAFTLLRGIKDLNIIGYDLVEVSPPYDPAQTTAIAAAAIMQEFLSQIAWRKVHGLLNPGA
ncbi:MAG: agmatinase [Lachnospiraceae bacterium]